MLQLVRLHNKPLGHACCCCDYCCCCSATCYRPLPACHHPRHTPVIAAAGHLPPALPASLPPSLPACLSVCAVVVFLRLRGPSKPHSHATLPNLQPLPPPSLLYTTAHPPALLLLPPVHHHPLLLLQLVLELAVQPSDLLASEHVAQRLWRPQQLARVQEGVDVSDGDADQVADGQLLLQHQRLRDEEPGEQVRLDRGTGRTRRGRVRRGVQRGQTGRVEKGRRRGGAGAWKEEYVVMVACPPGWSGTLPSFSLDYRPGWPDW